MTELVQTELCPNRDLNAYIASVYQIPMLSDSEEKSLGDDLFYQNNLEAAQKLVLAHLRVVVSVSRQYLSYGLPQGDLIQEGNVGLMKAVKRFDPSKGVKLFSFAIHWIKAEMQEYILKNWKISVDNILLRPTMLHCCMIFSNSLPFPNCHINKRI